MKKIMKISAIVITMSLIMVFVLGCKDDDPVQKQTIGVQARSFLNIIDGLPDTGEITISEIHIKSEIEIALALYQEIPENDRKDEKVVAAKNKADALLDIIAGFEFVEAVNALPNPATATNYNASQRTTANNLNTNYNEFSAAVKALTVVIEARTRLDNVFIRIQAADFVSAVNALPAVNALTIEDKDAVNAAAALYDALPAIALDYANVITAKTNLDERAARITELEELSGLSQAARDFVNTISALPSDTAEAQALHVGAVYNAKKFYESITGAELTEEVIVSGKTKLDQWLPAVEGFRQLPTRIATGTGFPRMFHVHSSSDGVDIGRDGNGVEREGGSTDDSGPIVPGGQDYRLSQYLAPQQGHVHGMQIAVYPSDVTQAQIDDGSEQPIGYFWIICGFGEDGFELDQVYMVPSIDPNEEDSLPNRDISLSHTPSASGDSTINSAAFRGLPSSEPFRKIMTAMDPTWTGGDRSFRFTARFVATDSGAFITGAWSTITANEMRNVQYIEPF